MARYAGRRIGRAALRAIPIVGNAMAAYDVARGVYGLGRRLFSRGTQAGNNGMGRRSNAVNTETTGKYKRAYGRVSGRYAGKIAPSKRVKGGFKAKAQAKGFSIHFEKGGAISDPYCAYIGHGACPQVIMRRLMLGVIVKALLRRMGISFSNVVQPLTYLTANDQVQIAFTTDPESGVQQSAVHTLGAAQPSFQGLLDGVVNAWVTAVQAVTGTNSQEWKLVEARFNPGGTGDLTSVRIPLENAKISFECSSQMKIQNRSVPAEGDDTIDEVDRIPLTGKIYQFVGNGTNFKRTANASLGEIPFEPIGEKQDGLFTFGAGAAGAAATLREPPLAYNFVRCKKHSRVYCNPGEIKMSMVNYKRTMYLQTLLRYVVGASEAATLTNTATQHHVGMFNLIAMEKVIETSNVPSTQPIQLAWELDYKIFGYLENKYLDNTIGEHYFGTQPN